MDQRCVAHEDTVRQPGTDCECPHSSTISSTDPTLGATAVPTEHLCAEKTIPSWFLPVADPSSTQLLPAAGSSLQLAPPFSRWLLQDNLPGPDLVPAADQNNSALNLKCSG